MLVSAIQGLYGQQMSYLQLDRIPLQADASTISCILQDQSGLIWMGSNAGLLSYDGYTIQSHFEYGKNSNVRIYCGVVAGDSIFLGADNGLLIYNYKTITLLLKSLSQTMCVVLLSTKITFG